MIKKGFTLAEVLITLAIIGVIAAISVPSLIQKTNQAELITAWKKDFATISQAANKYAFDAGTIPNYEFANQYSNAFKDYLKFVKSCDNDTDGACWHQANNWTYLSGSPYYLNSGSTRSNSAILANGSLFRFDSNVGFNCISNVTNYNTSTDGCLYIEVDINGFKKPNTIGKDIYGTIIYSDGTVIPLSLQLNSGWNCTANGWGCSSEYLYKTK